MDTDIHTVIATGATVAIIFVCGKAASFVLGGCFILTSKWLWRCLFGLCALTS